MNQTLDLLSIKAICQFKRISRSTLYEAGLRGGLPEPALIDGNRKFWRKEDIEHLELKKKRGRKKK